MSTWSIVESSFVIEKFKAYEGFMTLGSGYLHVRGSLEEGLADFPQNVTFLMRPEGGGPYPETRSKCGTYVPGVYGNHPLLRRQMINLPNPLDLVPTVAGEKLDMLKSSVSGYQREINFQNATLTREVVWKTAAGPEIAVKFERFVSAARPALVVQRMTLTPTQAVEVDIRGGIDSDVRTRGFDHLSDVKFRKAGASMLAFSAVTETEVKLDYVTRLSAPKARWSFIKGKRLARLGTVAKIAAGESFVVEKVTAVATSRDLNPRSAEDILAEIGRKGYDKLFAEHAAVWQQRWDASDVVIEGDDRSQVAERASVYHLLRSHVPGDDRVAIEAKAYAGEQYAGMFFWDTEMYMLPFFLYTAPEKARTLTDFRVRTLPAARQGAARGKYAGARYPWEADGEGNECCVHWQYRDLQVHITADVAYGLLHYAAAANDPGYLQGPAAEVLVETSRYWITRMEKRVGRSGYNLLGVMGPDEFTLMQSNNPYTNRMVQLSMNAAAKVAREGGAAPEEAKTWTDAAATLPIPREGDLVLQSEEFPDYAEMDIDKAWAKKHMPFCWQVPIEKYYRSRVLKQADVLMLMMLFPTEFTDAEVRRAWDYYVPLTTHDSSLSAGVHAIMAVRLGLDDEAFKFWRKSSETDLDFTGYGAEEGIHIAGAGNNWQVPVFGFAGMLSALQSDVLTLRPRLPKQWSRLAFPIQWKGCPAYVSITPGKATVSNRGQGPLAVKVYEQSQTLAPGQSGEFTV